MIDPGRHIGQINAVRFTGDSQRLCTAGMDKVVRVWRLNEGAGGANTAAWESDRTFRWGVSRGLRGVVYRLGRVGPREIAFGGYGYWTRNEGRVQLFEAASGQSTNALAGLVDTVDAIATSPDGGHLAAGSKDGAVRVWRLGEQTLSWQAAPARPTADGAWYERWAPVQQVALGNDKLILPRLVAGQGTDRPQWRLTTRPLKAGAQATEFGPRHHRQVTALAIAPGGDLAASADTTRTVWLHNLATGDSAKLPYDGPTAMSLAFDGKGERLAIGSDTAPGGAKLAIFTVADKKLLRERNLKLPLRALDVSPDGRFLAYGQGVDVVIEGVASGEFDDFEGLAPVTELVALEGEGGRSVAYRTPGAQGEKTLKFDATKLDVERFDGEFVGFDATGADWKVTVTPSRDRLTVQPPGAEATTITLDEVNQGRYQCHAVLSDAGGKAYALAVGTELQCNVLVYRLAPGGAGRLVRAFRGHQDRVNAITQTADRRFLVSASADGTVRYWSIEGLAAGDQDLSIERLWGVRLEPNANGLLVGHVDPLGPLFRKGVRKGDVLTELAYFDASDRVRRTKDAGQMTRSLRAVQINRHAPGFFFARNDRPVDAFVSMAAWRPALTLVGRGPSEWIATHPTGYYERGAAGNKLLGFQVNHALDAPEFIELTQLEDRFRRPEVFHELLAQGTWPPLAQDASEAVGEAPRPTVAITRPSRAELSSWPFVDFKPNDDPLVIEAEVSPNGAEVRDVQLVIDGGPTRIRHQRLADRDGKQRYRWRYSPEGVAGDRRIAVRVVERGGAGGLFSESPDDQRLTVRFRSQQTRKRFVLLAIGVADYNDDDIQDLSFSDDDARIVAETLAGNLGAYYEFDRRVLTDQEANQRTILAELDRLESRSRPGDVVLVSFSGHGARDSHGALYLCPSDASYPPKSDATPDVCDREMRTTFVDIADVSQALSKLAERDIVLLLDACHSGAAFLGRATGVEADAGRMKESLIGPRLNVITSSSGAQESIEYPTHRAGLFTHVVRRGLEGEADTSLRNSREFISYPELGAYVADTVDYLSQSTQRRQTPVWIKGVGDVRLTTAPFRIAGR